MITALKRAALVIPSVLILFPILYFAAVLAGGLIPAIGGGVSEDTEAVIFLENNGRHIDIWLPADVCGPLYEGRSGWLSFGWGDRDFYLSTPYAENLNIQVLLKTLFLPTRAVLAVEFSANEPWARDIRAVTVGRSGAEAAWSYISSFFVPDSSGEAFALVPAGLVHPSYGDVVFYEAKGRYSIFYTCNNWTGRVLKAAGVETGLWTPLTFGVYRE
ncbi:MAG: DUF2459 domain-containing protein [Spirochaetales bacterium]|nr:DUF2459 domain-containing protein [Spirochaetales bacterium]